MSQRSQSNWGRYAVTVAGVGILLLGLAVSLGLLLTGRLKSTSIMTWDRQYPVELEEMRTTSGEEWSSFGSLMGETLTVIAVAVAIGIVLLAMRRWCSVLLLATALILEVSVFVLTTLFVTRDRPGVHQLDVSPPTSSFPSGHTAAATALALSLAVIVSWNVSSRTWRGISWLLALAAGPIVAFSRVYRGMHHPSDVLVGFLLGATCVAIAYVAVARWAGDATRHVAPAHAAEEKI